jgi:hypothetical protein
MVNTPDLTVNQSVRFMANYAQRTSARVTGVTVPPWEGHTVWRRASRWSVWISIPRRRPLRNATRLRSGGRGASANLIRATVGSFPWTVSSLASVITK